jgi:hypothetical protein
MDNIMFMQREPRSKDQEAFDEAKLGWSVCTTREELEEKLEAIRVIAARLHPKDMRHGFITILSDALQDFKAYNDKVARHFLRKGDFLTDYKRAEQGLPAKGQIVAIWKDGGHTTTVDVKFPPTDKDLGYKSYNWEAIRGKYYGSKLGYVFGD